MDYTASLAPVFSDIDQRLHALEENPASGLEERLGAAEQAIVSLVGVGDGLVQRADEVDERLGLMDQSLSNTQAQADLARGEAGTAVTQAGLARDAATSAGMTATAAAEAAAAAVAGANQAMERATSANDRVTTLANSTAVRFGVAEDEADALADRVVVLENRPPSQGTSRPGEVSLDSFTGADATAKMRAAFTTLAAESAGRRRALVMPPGTTLAPGTVPFVLFDGATIVGGVTPETEFSNNSRVTVSGAAPNGVFALAGNTRDVMIANIGWEGPGASQVCRFMPDNFTNQLQYSQFQGLSFDNFTSVLRQRLLGFVWSGSGYCNNSTETPFEFSGSDWDVWNEKFYLDSPNLKDSDFLVIVRSGNKARLGQAFITGDGPTPVKVMGGQHVVLDGLQMEAEGVPRKTAGAGLLVTGGNVTVLDPWFFRTMFDPTSTALGRVDQGVVHVVGDAHVRLVRPTFGEYNTTPERPGGHTENHVYAAGTSVVEVDAPLPWNMQANSGTGGHASARSFTVAKAGSAAIRRSTYAAL